MLAPRTPTAEGMLHTQVEVLHVVLRSTGWPGAVARPRSNTVVQGLLVSWHSNGLAPAGAEQGLVHIGASVGLPLESVLAPSPASEIWVQPATTWPSTVGSCSKAVANWASALLPEQLGPIEYQSLPPLRLML